MKQKLFKKIKDIDITISFLSTCDYFASFYSYVKFQQEIDKNNLEWFFIQIREYSIYVTFVNTILLPIVKYDFLYFHKFVCK